MRYPAADTRRQTTTHAGEDTTTAIHTIAGATSEKWLWMPQSNAPASANSPATITSRPGGRSRPQTATAMQMMPAAPVSHRHRQAARTGYRW
jgi:hypothetical protein